MDYGDLNLVSLLLGVVAIMIPFAQKTLKTSAIRICISFSFSLIAIGCQIAIQNHWVQIGDFAAVADTIGSVLVASTTLIALTILSNLFSLLKVKKGRVFY